MTPAEFIAVCRRLGACERGIARFRRRRGTVHQRLAAMAKASQRGTCSRETRAELDLKWLADRGPREYARRLVTSGWGFIYDVPKPKRRAKR